jgi:hypothetical protein
MANSKRRCKHCGAYCLVVDGVIINGMFFCCQDHVVAFAMEARESQREKLAKQGRAKAAKNKKSSTRARRDAKRKSVRWQHKQTQPVFNLMRKLQEFSSFQDKDMVPTCISCGKPKGDDEWSCGHFRSVGASSHLRYDEKNTYLQHLKNCNSALSGDLLNYRQGIINRFGDKEGHEIIDYNMTAPQSKKWHWQELETMRAEFKLTIKELEEKLNV